MIGVKMTETDEVEFLETRAGFTEAQERPAARVDQDPGRAVNPDDIAR